MPQLPTALQLALEQSVKGLKPHVARRRLLGERAQEELALFEAEICRLRAKVPDDALPLYHTILDLLATAARTTGRVVDLLAAEKEIGWLRGIRDPKP